MQENRIIFGHPLVYPCGAESAALSGTIDVANFPGGRYLRRGTVADNGEPNLHGANPFSLIPFRSHFCLVFMPLVNALDKHKAWWLHFKDRQQEKARAWENNGRIDQSIDNQPHNAVRAALVLLWLPWNHRPWTVNNGIFDHSPTRTGSQNTTWRSEFILKTERVNSVSQDVTATCGKHNFGSAWYQNVNRLF